MISTTFPSIVPRFAQEAGVVTGQRHTSLGGSSAAGCGLPDYSALNAVSLHASPHNPGLNLAAFEAGIVSALTQGRTA